MAGIISIEAYEQAERRALIARTVPELMAFRPVTFEQVGYPTQVRFEEELARYVDHNFEGEVPGLYEKGAAFAPIGYVNAFTPDEQRLLDDIRDAVAALTLRHFGRAMRPITNLMVQMGPYRAIHHLAHSFGLPPLTVFEVGPGLGYLGALLAGTGHRYLSYDITQSLYLWQNRLLAEIAEEQFVEMAIDPYPERLLTERVVHLPWWEYVKFLSGTSVRADIVYSNSNLGEMSLLALKHVLHISRHMLAGSKLGLFMYFSTGMCAQNSAESIAAEFAQFGYQKVFDTPFVAYVLDPDNSASVAAAFKDGIPHVNPTLSDVRLTANEVMGLRRTEAPLDVQLTAWNYGWQPPFID
jgi:hypothetical protein